MSGTAEVAGEFIYGRYGNPSRSALEATLAALEDSKYALTFSSGKYTFLKLIYSRKKLSLL